MINTTLHDMLFKHSERITKLETSMNTLGDIMAELGPMFQTILTELDKLKGNEHRLSQAPDTIEEEDEYDPPFS